MSGHKPPADQAGMMDKDMSAGQGGAWVSLQLLKRESQGCIDIPGDPI